MNLLFYVKFCCSPFFVVLSICASSSSLLLPGHSFVCLKFGINLNSFRKRKLDGCIHMDSGCCTGPETVFVTLLVLFMVY